MARNLPVGAVVKKHGTSCGRRSDAKEAGRAIGDTGELIVEWDGHLTEIYTLYSRILA